MVCLLKIYVHFPFRNNIFILNHQLQSSGDKEKNCVACLGMDNAAPADVINESLSEKVMEDVGLMSSKLNSETSETADNVASTCEKLSSLSPMDDNLQLNGDEQSQIDDEVQSLFIAEDSDESEEDDVDEEDEEMPELVDSDGTGNVTGTKEDGGTTGETSDEEAPPAIIPNHGSTMKEASKNVDSFSGETENDQQEDDLQRLTDKGDQNQK